MLVYHYRATHTLSFSMRCRDVRVRAVVRQLKRRDPQAFTEHASTCYVSSSVHRRICLHVELLTRQAKKRHDAQTKYASCETPAATSASSMSFISRGYNAGAHRPTASSDATTAKQKHEKKPTGWWCNTSCPCSARIAGHPVAEARLRARLRDLPSSPPHCEDWGVGSNVLAKAKCVKPHPCPIDVRTPPECTSAALRSRDAGCEEKEEQQRRRGLFAPAERG